ncbi:hypothetical protein CALCODRAFT_494755 [Calocera cornea HHB12733]|uniref:Glutamine amidotransferase type-2 domain-containing protein n=1 Tax=Calocera cornea HHB12733 TaxID=1353952 RepID=A0A165GUL1_9BASI|nr:hypothetical protein CALCODRAFT_494755 [Calocera cornea HHB12733]
MCGIVFSLRRGTDSFPEANASSTENVAQWKALCELNACRGPDHRAEHVVQLECPGGKVELTFFSSVLHLRGKEVTKQPFVSEDGDVFCWNGEVFEGLDIGEEENDGALLFRALSAAQDPRDVFAQLEGPYAFVYLKRSARRLYFARDPLGRRSLLKHQSEEQLLLASVGIDKVLEPEEVSPVEIHCIDLETFVTDGLESSIDALPRHRLGAKPEWLKPQDVNAQLPSSSEADVEDALMQQSVKDFLDVLEESVRLRVQHIPRMNKEGERHSRVAVLFSGGVDCTLLACLAHRCLPLEEGIDLLNVAFENPRKLGLAQQKGKKKQKPMPGKATAGEDAADGSESLADKYAVPDRVTGLDAVQELRAVCPGRRWNFVAVNVPYDECLFHQPHVEQLMRPSDTVMDLSLANALYFASRGSGLCQPTASSPWVPYCSPARVLLSGLGADEQLGGYSRHRRAFARDGWAGLVAELQMDVDRLPARNLGRDDRVTSSWGKETRYPYLSLSLIDFLSQLPVERKVNPLLPEGEGDKRLLRLAAKSLGMRRAAGRRKRAMQFGSRSARMGEADRKGHLRLEDI